MFEILKKKIKIKADVEGWDTVAMKRDHQSNGLECLSAVVALCRRELTTVSIHTTLRLIDFETETIRLQTALRQRERECAEHLATIQQLRQIRNELEYKLNSAPMDGIYHSVLPDIAIDTQEKDAGEWHLTARTFQKHMNTYKRTAEIKSEELAIMRVAYQNLKTLLSPQHKENAQVASVLAAYSSTEAP